MEEEIRVPEVPDGHVLVRRKETAGAAYLPMIGRVIKAGHLWHLSRAQAEAGHGWEIVGEEGVVAARRSSRPVSTPPVRRAKRSGKATLSRVRTVIEPEPEPVTEPEPTPAPEEAD